MGDCTTAPHSAVLPAYQADPAAAQPGRCPGILFSVRMRNAVAGDTVRPPRHRKPTMAPSATVLPATPSVPGLPPQHPRLSCPLRAHGPRHRTTTTTLPEPPLRHPHDACTPAAAPPTTTSVMPRPGASPSTQTELYVLFVKIMCLFLCLYRENSIPMFVRRHHSTVSIRYLFWALVFSLSMDEIN
jgi:hypothetical protein